MRRLFPFLLTVFPIRWQIIMRLIRILVLSLVFFFLTFFGTGALLVSLIFLFCRLGGTLP